MDVSTQHFRRMVILAGVAVLAVLVLGVRFLPCMVDAGTGTWKFWSFAAPNLVCSLDLSDQSTLTAEDLESVSTFTNLESLNLSRSGLTRIPASVFTLTKLQSLLLDGNAIAALPSDLRSLTSLRTLSLEGNALVTVPSLAGLQNLTSLTLANNEISSVAGGLLPSGLETLDLSGNPANTDQDQQEAIQKSLPDTEVVFTASSSSSSAAATASPAPSSSVAAIASSAAAQSSTAMSAGTASSAASTGAAQASSVAAVPSSAAASSVVTTASSATVASSVASSAQPVPPPDCVHNFQVQAYSFCIPPAWEAQTQGGQTEFTDPSGTPVARLRCPIQQTSYDQYSIVTHSRTYIKNGDTYGADLWTGTNTQDGALLIVFLHLHDFNSWYGDNYQDVNQSCQIQGLRPEQDAEVFDVLYRSVQ